MPLGWFVIYRLGLDIVYTYAKFEPFNRSRDIGDAHQNLNASCDLTTPLRGWFVIRWLELATINLPVGVISS